MLTLKQPTTKHSFVPTTLQEKKNHLKFLVMTLVPAQQFY